MGFTSSSFWVHFHTIPSILKLDGKTVEFTLLKYFHTIPSILKLGSQGFYEDILIVFPYDSVYFKAYYNDIYDICLKIYFHTIPSILKQNLNFFVYTCHKSISIRFRLF